MAPDKECEDAVYAAIKDGYRLIDTAVAYANQKAVGNAIKRCIEEGIVKREELFITTKLWLTEWKPEDVEKSVKICLEELQLDYIDLFLLHQSVLMNLPKELDDKRRQGYFFDRPLIPRTAPSTVWATRLTASSRLGARWRSCAVLDISAPSAFLTSPESVFRTCCPSVL